jgi:heparan-alpha-glucosaminide N-acetyltransferase
MTETKIDFTKRNVGIDLLRALTMFVMIFVNDFWKIHDVPKWLEHATRGEDFLGLSDVVFPAFLFVVGMSIPFAIERRYAKGKTGESTIRHILSRTLALLVMGAFITNSEARLSPEVNYGIGVYFILMVVAFIFIWNHYPYTENPKRKQLYSILKIIGLIILFFLAVTFRSTKGEVFGAHWGILGTIGWTYMLCAFIYMYTRERLKYLILVWIVFMIICVLGSRMNETWGGTPILSIPHPNFYNDILNILHIGKGTSAALTTGGIILSLITTKYMQTARQKKAWLTILAIVILLLAGIFSRQFWILSKLGGTPTLIFFISAIAVGTYAVLNWLAETDRAGWLKVIKPAGTATLTCYLMPYIAYGLADITGIVLPDWFTHGFMGIVNSLCFALLIIAVTYILGRVNIKLKI